MARVLLLFFVVVGMVALLRLRALKSPAKRALPRIEPEVPLPTEIVSKRAKELSGKWEAESSPRGAKTRAFKCITAGRA